MKKILFALTIVLILATITPITSYASDEEEKATDLYERDRDAFYKKYMCLDKEAEEKGLYSDANNGAFVKRNKTSKKSNKQSTTTTTTTVTTNRGWVYSTDELHVVGLPEDSETGYTKAGDYGVIPKE